MSKCSRVRQDGNRQWDETSSWLLICAHCAHPICAHPKLKPWKDLFSSFILLHYFNVSPIMIWIAVEMKRFYCNIVHTLWWFLWLCIKECTKYVHAKYCEFGRQIKIFWLFWKYFFFIGITKTYKTQNNIHTKYA